MTNGIDSTPYFRNARYRATQRAARPSDVPLSYGAQPGAGFQKQPRFASTECYAHATTARFAAAKNAALPTAGERVLAERPTPVERARAEARRAKAQRAAASPLYRGYTMPRVRGDRARDARRKGAEHLADKERGTRRAIEFDYAVLQLSNHEAAPREVRSYARWRAEKEMRRKKPARALYGGVFILLPLHFVRILLTI